ncbi:hypothetical protein ABZ410_16025 [Streptomyces cinnamoneus]|uniref:hypothetical protein n=1 Tax=Streptomyces cinnamoneus TaxID=53446 RepID=UPI0034034BE8
MPASIQRASERFVRSLSLPSVTGIRDLLPEVERRTQRAVKLEPAEVGWSAPCGMWVATAETHYIFYDPRTSIAHQDHIIAHEVAHILKRHQGQRKVPAEATEGLLALLDPELIQSVLGRAQYDDAEELEAELVGTYLQAHVHHHQKYQVAISDETESDRVARTFLRRRSSP